MTDYPDFIKELIKEYSTEKVIGIDETPEHRFKIEYYLDLNKQQKNTLIVFMMNPSEANRCKSDPTINSILEYSENKFDKVIVLNSLSLYESDSNELKTYNMSYAMIKENINKIEMCLKENINATVVVNAGEPKTRAGAESLTHIYDLLREDFATFSFPKIKKEEEKHTLTGYPRHISRKSKIDNSRELIPLDLNDYSSYVKV